MLRSPQIRAGLFLKLPDVLDEAGVSSRSLCADVGIDPSVLDDAEEMIAVDAAAALLERASDLTNDPDFGLKFARSVPLGASGLFGQLQLAAPTVGDMVRGFAHYAELFMLSLRPEYRVDERTGHATFTTRLPIGFGKTRLQLADLLVAVMVDRIRLGAGPLWYPRYICMETKRPLDDRIYQNLLGSNIFYEASSFVVAIEAEVLDRELPNRVMGLFDRIRPLADDALAELADALMSASASVRHTVESMLDADRTVTLETVSRRLDMTPRSLQWRLEREGTSFDTVLTQVRLERARLFLASPHMTIAQVSGRLGFSEPSGFSRWCGRVMHMTPSEYRALLRSGGEAKLIDADEAADADATNRDVCGSADMS